METDGTKNKMEHTQTYTHTQNLFQIHDAPTPNERCISVFGADLGRCNSLQWRHRRKKLLRFNCGAGFSSESHFFALLLRLCTSRVMRPAAVIKMEKPWNYCVPKMSTMATTMNDICDRFAIRSSCKHRICCQQIVYHFHGWADDGPFFISQPCVHHDFWIHWILLATY